NEQSCRTPIPDGGIIGVEEVDQCGKINHAGPTGQIGGVYKRFKVVVVTPHEVVGRFSFDTPTEFSFGYEPCHLDVEHPATMCLPHAFKYSGIGGIVGQVVDFPWIALRMIELLHWFCSPKAPLRVIAQPCITCRLP